MVPRLPIVSVLMLLLLAGDASAQYFGKNKVQYRRHQFHVLQTEHFDIYFHQDRREAVDVVGRLAERWWRRLSRVFEQELSGRQPIVLYSSKPDFDQTLIVSGLIDGGTAGVTEPGRRRIALPFAPSWPTPITCSVTRSCMRFSSTCCPWARHRRSGEAQSRCHSGWLRASRNT